MSSITDFSKNPTTRILLFGGLLGLILIILLGPKLPATEDRKVIVGDAEFAFLLAQWEKTWQRQPTMEELKGLVQSHIREEILYKEAINEGLDKENAMVKRALITQMNLLGASQGSAESVTRADVEAYYSLRQEKFLQEDQIAFYQLYFSQTSQDPKAEEKAKIQVQQLTVNGVKPVSAKGQGVVTMLPFETPLSDLGRINNTFGEGFGEKLNTLPIDQWSGPIESSFGWHVIYISSKSPGGPIPLDEIYEEVLRELEYEEKEAATEQFYTDLLQRYEVIYQGELKSVLNEK